MLKIKTDSRKITPGDTFVAIKGETVDGHDFIKKAITSGATKIVAEHGEYEVETLIVPSTPKYIVEELENNYKYVLEGMKFIGITGTNGKTTTAFLVHQMLEQLGEKSAYFGTIGLFINEELVRELPNTTPEIVDIYALIDEAKERGCTTIIMEASSHALEQRRLAGITFDIGAFTNLTQDHLDYHETMKKYLDAKLILLKMLKENGTMIVNADDQWHEAFLEDRTLTLGKEGKDYQILDFELKQGMTHINFKASGKDYYVETNFTGSFNIYNYLMATAIVVANGYELDDVLKLAETVYPPKGRCHTILFKSGQVVVDFAHTPDAVEKILECFNNVKTKRIITLVGCGGDRDPKKRPIMGKLASENSDIAIFTNDNPRTEDEKQIMEHILAGVAKDNYIVEYDREKAIKTGLEMMGEGDILLLLGKGHENYQVIGHEKIHLDDAEIVENYIKNQ